MCVCVWALPQALTEEGAPGIVCDLRVFSTRAFGLGSFVLSPFGALGGVDPRVYRCMQAMRFGALASPLKREEATLEVFNSACKNHKDQLLQAEATLAAGLAAANTQLLLQQRTGEGERAKETREETERLRAMQRAVQQNKAAIEICITYFSNKLEALKGLMED